MLSEEIGDNRRMKFTQEIQSAVTIRSVEPGSVRIGDQTVKDDVVLFRNSVTTGWQSNDISKLTVEDLAELIAEQPEIIIFGTGWAPVLPPRELVFALARKGIGLETMDTPAACRTFNILINENRDVAAILILD